MLGVKVGATGWQSFPLSTSLESSVVLRSRELASSLEISLRSGRNEHCCLSTSSFCTPPLLLLILALTRLLVQVVLDLLALPALGGEHLTHLVDVWRVLALGEHLLRRLHLLQRLLLDAPQEAGSAPGLVVESARELRAGDAAAAPLTFLMRRLLLPPSARRYQRLRYFGCLRLGGPQYRSLIATRLRFCALLELLDNRRRLLHGYRRLYGSHGHLLGRRELVGLSAVEPRGLRLGLLIGCALVLHCVETLADLVVHYLLCLIC
jgi:hypothetical protein